MLGFREAFRGISELSLRKIRQMWGKNIPDGRQHVERREHLTVPTVFLMPTLLGMVIYRVYQEVTWNKI